MLQLLCYNLFIVDYMSNITANLKYYLLVLETALKPTNNEMITSPTKKAKNILGNHVDSQLTDV